MVERWLATVLRVEPRWAARRVRGVGRGRWTPTRAARTGHDGARRAVDHVRRAGQTARLRRLPRGRKPVVDPDPGTGSRTGDDRAGNAAHLGQSGRGNDVRVTR